MTFREKNLETLMGEPRKALTKLSIPMIISNFVFTLYILADGVWVAGLGPNALSAVGIFFPLFFIFLAISLGLNVGSNSAISRRIGARDFRGASLTATHAFLVGFLVSIPMTASALLLTPAMTFLGAVGEVLQLSIEYGRIMVLGSVFLVFNNTSMGILNGEGNAKRAMYANTIGSVLNIILDPVFIYVLNLGVAGAAYASVFSMIISSSVFLFWFLTGKTFVKPEFPFKWDWKIVFDLFRVGMPSSLSMLTMSVAFMLINRLVIETGGNVGLAAYTSAWRLIHFGFVPLFGMGAALTAVTGAAYGSGNPKKIDESLNYAVKLLLLIDAAILFAMVAFAPQISKIFIYTEASAVIYEEVVKTIKITAFILLFAPLGVSSASVFQGMGMGERSFAITILRSVVSQVSLAYLLSIPFGFEGVLLGIVLGEAVGCFVGFGWAKFTVRG